MLGKKSTAESPSHISPREFTSRFRAFFFQTEPPSFSISTWLFGRVLGIVCLIAFLSYWHQAEAIIGEHGINPWQEDLKKIESLPQVKESFWNKWSLRPTLLWILPFPDHDLLFATGTIFATFLAIGFLPLLSGIISYLCYLSLMVVGEPFLSFQWDILLVETLLLSLPLLPGIKFHHMSSPVRQSTWARLLIIALLTKLMLESGIVKFTYFDADGSNAWRELNALQYHYWTQPLPHGFSSWIDSFPRWFDSLSLYFMYAVELGLPFLFFMPGNLRRFAALGQILLQVLILLSGNYGFFNLLTVLLCIPLIDDRIWSNLIRKKTEQISLSRTIRWKSALRDTSLFVLWTFFLATTWKHLSNDIRGNRTNLEMETLGSKWIDEMQMISRPFRCFNSYGLFRVMTKTRPEIIIETSQDGQSWELVKFKWKPSHPQQKPRFAGPHMPRIDWQMWFEGLNFERYAAHPFSRFLYGRFLEMTANGADFSDFSDLRRVLGDQEFNALSQASPKVQKQVMNNYNNLINSFLSRSLWFGRLLNKILENRQEVLELLHVDNDTSLPPQFLRISLMHYQFSNTDDSFWEANEIPHATYQIKRTE